MSKSIKEVISIKDLFNRLSVVKWDGNDNNNDREIIMLELLKYIPIKVLVESIISYFPRKIFMIYDSSNICIRLSVTLQFTYKEWNMYHICDNYQKCLLHEIDDNYPSSCGIYYNNNVEKTSFTDCSICNSKFSGTIYRSKCMCSNKDYIPQYKNMQILCQKITQNPENKFPYEEVRFGFQCDGKYQSNTILLSKDIDGVQLKTTRSLFMERLSLIDDI